MWWNFVARTRDEIDAAYAVVGGRRTTGSAGWRSALPRIPASAPYWQELRSRP